jgi:hypothetical protein
MRSELSEVKGRVFSPDKYLETLDSRLNKLEKENNELQTHNYQLEINKMRLELELKNKMGLNIGSLDIANEVVELHFQVLRTQLLL